jgi:glycosyltransferase involved in cell wall biosynthesis
MRVLLVNRFAHRIGGIEVYLQRLMPELLRRKHDLALLSEEAAPQGSQAIAPHGVPSWCCARADTGSVLDAVGEWRPDVVFAHQLVRPEVLGRLLGQWPSLYFAHCYVGVCVSGTKCWKRPHPRVCERRLGWGCLVHYFPHGCGGLNPIAMWRLFVQQRADQLRLRAFDLITTHSEHVRGEYLRHGFAAGRVIKAPFWVPGELSLTGRQRLAAASDPLRLLFLGRCEVVKGGGLLIKALPWVASRLGRRVELEIGGDGPARCAWQRQAREIMRRHPDVRITLPGWLEADSRDRAILRAHVVVVPSVWPEPFGMAGIEAGFHGVPAVAFAVGGVREWLEDGVNGHLAPGDRPSAEGLAGALCRVFASDEHYQSLSAGAREATRRFRLEPHLAAVEDLLGRAASAASLRLSVAPLAR